MSKIHKLSLFEMHGAFCKFNQFMNKIIYGEETCFEEISVYLSHDFVFQPSLNECNVYGRNVFLCYRRNAI